MPQKWCQQEGDQSLRVKESLHPPCSFPETTSLQGLHLATCLSFHIQLPSLQQSALAEWNRCQSALGTTEKSFLSFPTNPQIQPLHILSYLISISRIWEVIFSHSWMLRRLYSRPVRAEDGLRKERIRILCLCHCLPMMNFLLQGIQAKSGQNQPY